MRVSRKIRREAGIQARKTFRAAIKDEVVLKEYQKRFKDGYEAGYEQGFKEGKAYDDNAKTPAVVSAHTTIISNEPSMGQ